jgi:hypothetical protein
MTSQLTTLAPRDPATERLAAAAVRLYDAEVALHIAGQSQVDRWVAAAYDRLHQAVAEHTAALADRDISYAPCA